MKNLVIILLILTIPSVALSQHRYPSRRSNDFTKLSIGPQIAGMAFMAKLNSDEGKFFFGYSLGAEINIRPVRPIGLTTGFSYNKIINYNRFYSAPVTLNFFTNDDLVISAGPIFYLSAVGDKVNFREPLIGGSLGFIKNSFGLTFYYFPESLIPDQNISFIIGLMIKLNIQLIII